MRSRVAHGGVWLAVLSLVFLGCKRVHHDGWHKVAPLPEPRWFDAAGVGSDGRIYVFGGYVFKKIREPGVGSFALVIYDPKTNTWQRGPAPPLYRFHVRDASLHIPWRITQTIALPYEVPNGGSDNRGRIYWFCHAGPMVFVPKEGRWIEPTPPIWHQDERRWEGSAPGYSRSSSATATGPKGRLYLVAGLGSPPAEWRPDKVFQLLKSVEVYDPVANTWSETAPMHRRRQLEAAAFGPDGKLYVFGGYGGQGSIAMRPKESEEEFERRYKIGLRLARHSLDSVEAYDPNTNAWSSRAPMPLGVEGAGAALGADGRIYVVGGTVSYSNPDPLRRVQVYDPRTDTWSEGPKLQEARYGGAVVATPDGRIWAIGGSGAGDEVEVLDTRPGENGGTR